MASIGANLIWAHFRRPSRAPSLLPMAMEPAQNVSADRILAHAKSMPITTDRAASRIQKANNDWKYKQWMAGNHEKVKPARHNKEKVEPKPAYSDEEEKQRYDEWRKQQEEAKYICGCIPLMADLAEAPANAPTTAVMAAPTPQTMSVKPAVQPKSVDLGPQTMPAPVKAQSAPAVAQKEAAVEEPVQVL